MLYDNHGRPISYVRIAVTDRCNLRCHYCMPEHGLEWLSRSELLTYEEILRICHVLAQLGIDKVRLTGGEPFVRKDMMKLIAGLFQIDGIQHIALTTNGVATAPHVPELKRLGIRSVNLSLDTLQRERFFEITRRDEFPSVMKTLDALLSHEISVKINAVVMDGMNTDELIDLARLTKDMPVDMRFIEEMPFNGGDHETQRPSWDHRRILENMQSVWPTIRKLPDPPFSTAYHYQIPGHIGKIGIIAAWSRTFCGTCNRIRITPQGVLKTCLYDQGGIAIREAIRSGIDDSALASILRNAMSNRYKDGWEAEKARTNPVAESMATIGG